MQQLSKLFLAIALSASAAFAHAADAEAQASKRFSIHAEVTKDGKVVSTGTQEIGNGGTAQFTDSKFKEIDSSVTVNCRTGWKRWAQFYKGRCDEPVREVENVSIGFNAKVGVREADRGNVLLYVDGNYVDVISEYNLEGVGADLRSASFRDSSLNSSMIIKTGQPAFVTNGGEGGEIRLKLTVTAI
ncbi:hypothetical protein [Pseudomonas putida]|uniref:Uncharacterized protein n=1 Tax=Pseudomonas putida TaxID=303 RepID=A0A1L7NMS8_PSEPU|nr:hypothetical protein [Pseudomonas putida]BAW26747.1 Uncharacterized protein KF715C_pA2420 [Pseudomonas putida]